jgi:hypothetical protein
VAAALRPVLAEVAGLPGAPAKVSQAPATYRQGSGNEVVVSRAGPALGGRPLAYRLLLPDQLNGPQFTLSGLAGAVRQSAGPAILASLVGGRGGSPAQQAVLAALSRAAHVPLLVQVAPDPGLARCHAPRSRCPAPPPPTRPPAWRPGTPAYAAAQRFAALPAAARHAWLASHLTALRAGRITLGQLP